MFGRGYYTQSVDIWAIGVICYEMVTGDFPFKNLYEGEVARKIKESEPKYDEANITNLCVNFIKKCL
jgi:serine/threonine protein kinase